MQKKGQGVAAQAALAGVKAARVLCPGMLGHTAWHAALLQAQLLLTSRRSR